MCAMSEEKEQNPKGLIHRILGILSLSLSLNPVLTLWAMDKVPSGRNKKVEIFLVSVNKDGDKLELLCIVSKNVKWCGHYAKQFSGFSKFFKYSYHVIQQFHSKYIHKIIKNTVSKRYMYSLFIEALFTISKRVKKSKYLLTDEWR